MTEETTQNPEDRRAAERAKVSLSVTWEGVLAIMKGEIVDLSTSGCFILTEDKVTTGELIRLEIQQPKSGALFLWAMVVYQMPEMGFGVSFTGGEDSEIKRLEWLVKAELHKVQNPSSEAAHEPPPD